MPRKHAARVDDNQAEVVGAIRAVGGVVTYLYRVGDGVADLLVSFRRRWFVIEVKDGKKSPSRRALSPEEKEWHDAQHAPVHIVLNGAEAVAVLTREIGQ